MINKQKTNYKNRPSLPYANISNEERLKIFANLIIDRIIEEEELYQERLKTDPDAKRIFEDCKCEKCLRKRNLQNYE